MRKAIVMGATSGIGMEVTKLLAAKGWQVGIAGRRVERLKAVMEEVNERSKDIPSKAVAQGGIITYKAIDVTSPNASSLLLELIEEMGGIDLYFHSSGIGWQNNFLDIEKELKTMETNGVGFVRMVDTAFNWFTAHQKKGRIACITSIAGTKGLGAAPAYSSTKRFQSHYLECLSQQAHMRHLPISITDIRPGFVKTDLIAGSNYPLQLSPSDVAAHIVRAIEKDKEVKVIDWRYSLLVFFWHLVPRWMWTRMRITS